MLPVRCQVQEIVDDIGPGRTKTKTDKNPRIKKKYRHVAEFVASESWHKDNQVFCPLMRTQTADDGTKVSDLALNVSIVHHFAFGR